MCIGITRSWVKWYRNDLHAGQEQPAAIVSDRICSVDRITPKVQIDSLRSGKFEQVVARLTRYALRLATNRNSPASGAVVEDASARRVSTRDRVRCASASDLASLGR